MSNLQQAPIIKHNGVKDRDSQHLGKAIRMHELEAAFACCLGAKDFAMYKVMMFLSGNAPEKFRVSEKIIMERCNISESGYKHARKKLVDMGWITHEPSQYIQVNFDKIYSDYDDYRQRCLEKSPASDGRTASLTAPDGGFSDSKGIFQNSTQGFPQYPYNNIRNNKENNKIENKIGHNMFCCEGTPSTMAQSAIVEGASSQPLREKAYALEDKKEAQRKYEKWHNDALERIEILYDIDDANDRKRMEESDDYRDFLEEDNKKRKEFMEKYGHYPII